MIPILISALVGFALAGAVWVIWRSIRRASPAVSRILDELAGLPPESEPLVADWTLAVVLAILLLILAA